MLHFKSIDSLHLENTWLTIGTFDGVHRLRVSSPISAHTTNGEITLEMVKLEAEVKGETTNGGIKLRLGAGQEINGLLEAETTNGTISLDIPITFQSLEKSKHRLRGQIGRGGPLISLATVNGSIHLTR